MTTKSHPAWNLEFFWMVSPKVSDFFVRNSTSKTLTKFDDHWTSPFLGLRIFLDGFTKSVRLFWEKFYFQDFNKVWWPTNLALSGTSKSFWMVSLLVSRLFGEKFHIQHFMSILQLVPSMTKNCSSLPWLMNFARTEFGFWKMELNLSD